MGFSYRDISCIKNFRSAEFTPKLFTVFQEGYGFAEFRRDFIAGLTVAIVALPLAMALGIASGATPEQGLITAVIAGFLISLLGGSRVQIGGPTGAFVVVIFDVIQRHGYDGLLLATLLAGIILIVAGYLRAGQIIKFVPGPVITGFTAGIAVIIASTQVKDFFGLKIEDVPADFIPKWSAYFSHFDSVNIYALAIGLGALALIISLRKFAPKVPGFLVAVLATSIVIYFYPLPLDTVGSRFPDIEGGIPFPHWPDFSLEKMKAVMPAAFTIAFLAGIEALLSATVADGMSGFSHRPNQELVAQGFANIGSSFFGGLPATGAIARTAANIRSGGRSPVAGIIHALLLLIFMYIGMDLLRYVPMAALAAILFMVAWAMSESHRFTGTLKDGGHDRIVLLLTFFLTVFVDLTVAIGVGVSLACLLFMVKISEGVEMETGLSRNATTIFSSEAFDEDQREGLPEGVEVFRISGPVFFGVSAQLIEIFKRIGNPPKILIIRMRYVPFLDASGVQVLEDVAARCQKSSTILIFSHVQSAPRSLMERHGLVDNGQTIFFAENYPVALALTNTLLSEG